MPATVWSWTTRRSKAPRLPGSNVSASTDRIESGTGNRPRFCVWTGYEKVPQGRIHFAGEHTSYNFQGFMEGGAESGQRAGQEVIAASSGQRSVVIGQ
jgi:hypothetical protein